MRISIGSRINNAVAGRRIADGGQSSKRGRRGVLWRRNVAVGGSVEG